MCSTPQAVIVDAGGALLESAAFVVVPAQAQCKDCRWLASLTLSGPVSATPIHILSSCLFCGAIAGALPVEARRLIAAYCAGDADALLALADLVEERGLVDYTPPRPDDAKAPPPLARWAEERQGWLEATGHEHVWMPWHSGAEHRVAVTTPRPVRRCTCGLFEHEAARPRRDDPIGDVPDQCTEPGCIHEDGHTGPHWTGCHDRNCQREAGHDPPHMARSAIHGYSGIEEHVDEWTDEDREREAADVAQAEVMRRAPDMLIVHDE